MGRSTWAPPPYSTDLLADELVGLLDALGIQRAHLYAMSMGGRVAQHTALRYPERLRSPVLVAADAGRPEATIHGVPVDVALQLGEHGCWGYGAEFLARH